MKIVVNPLDPKSVKQAIKELNRYKKWVQEKEEILRQRLTLMGASVASIEFSRAIYSGANDVSVRVTDDGKKATIFAEGSAVAFIEFGTGDKYGHGHPMNSQFGTGPGTWSDGPNGKGHWKNPNGWWFGDSQHTYGNPPAMAMVHARDMIAEQCTAIAREVFKS